MSFLSSPLATFLKRALRIGMLGLLWLNLAALAAGLNLHPNLELSTHFHAQIVGVSAILCIIGMLLRSRWDIIITLIILISNAILVFPIYLSRHLPPHDTLLAPPMRLMLANVYSSNTQYRYLLDLVNQSKPDVLVLEEVNADWVQALKALSTTYPYRVGEPRDDNFGILVLSKTPLENAQVMKWESYWPPSVQADIRWCDASWPLLATHPPPPLGEELNDVRWEQLRKVGDVAGANQRPGLLVGDLNVTFWSPLFTELQKRSGYFSARQGFGVLPTWPQALPMILRIPLDQVLHHPDIQILNMRLGTGIGSDHAPILVDVQFPCPALGQTEDKQKPAIEPVIQQPAQG